MKNLKITLCLILVACTGLSAQEEKAFFLSSDTVKVYSFDASTKGSQLEYEFEDDYTVKLTNKAYKISLFFKESERDEVQKTISKVLDGNNTSFGFQKMVWKQTSQEGKLMYKVELKDNKLRIEVFKRNMNTEAYAILNSLGQEFIKETNS